MQCKGSKWIGSACLAIALLAPNAIAQQPPRQGVARALPGDGQQDFDWEIGVWRTELRRLANPLSGSQEWLDYSGTSVVRKVMGGRGNLVELRVQGAAGQIEGVNLRLYNPQVRQWNLHYASLRNGVLTSPIHGGFRQGRGEFYGQEDLDGKAVLVRFVITRIAANTARFEQAYSQDGGRSWEVNWIATDTRIGGGEAGR